MMKRMNVKLAILSILMAIVMLIGVAAGASMMTTAFAAEVPTLPATEYVSPKSPTQPVPYDGVPVTPGKISSSNYRTYGLTDDNWSQYNGYYAIRNAKELYGFAELVNTLPTQTINNLHMLGVVANAVLLSDIVINTSVDPASNPYFWTPIGLNGDSKKTFSGVFDGNGYSISGFYQNYTDMKMQYAGIFASIGWATVKNLVIKDSAFYAGVYLGAVISEYTSESTLEGIRIEESVTLFADGSSRGFTELASVSQSDGYDPLAKNVYVGTNVSGGNASLTGIIAREINSYTYYENVYYKPGTHRPFAGIYDTEKAGHYAPLSSSSDAHVCAPIVHNQVNGTCYSSGLSAYTFCAVCEKVLSGEKTVLYGHTSDEFFYTQNKDDELKHDKRYMCCTEIAETIDHTYNNEACSACGYEMFARMGDYASTKAKNLVITSDVTVEGDDHLYVSSGYTLTVNPGVTLTVNSNLYNAGTIINNGAIVVKGAYSGEGTATCGETATYHPAFNENGFCQFCGDEDYPQAAPLVDGYYQIGNAGQLMWFSNFVAAGNTSANAKLVADIIYNEGDLSGLNGKTEGYRFWTPIGMIMNHENGIDNFVTYTGTFDGDGHFISGLYHFDYWSYDGYAGLVSRLGSGGVIKNVTVKNSYIATSRLAGAILGENRGGLVENCHNENTTVASAARVGGIVGDNTSGTIKYCTNKGNVKFFKVNSGLAFNFTEFGGIAGNTAGTLEFCTNYGDIICTEGIGGVGGIAGQVYQGVVKSCVNEGDINVTGGTNFGGITGYQYHGTLTSNINYGTIVGGNLAGGIIGNPFGNGGRYTHNYTVGGSACGSGSRDGCYSITEAELANGRLAFELGIGQEIGVDARPYVGGPAVYAYFNESGVVNYTNDENYTCYHAGGTPSCTTQATCDGCRNPYGEIPEGAHQFEITGREDEPNCTVCGGRCGVVAPHNTNYTDYCAVCGDWIGPELAEDGFYEIKTFGNLIWFAEKVNAGNYALNARLMENIVASLTFRSYDWKPIGGSSFDDTSVGYEGVFDGQGYAIALFPGTMTPGHDNAALGLFGTLKSGAIVKNLSISNRQDNYRDSAGTTYAYDGEYTVYFGLIAGRVLEGATVSGCRVANSTVSISNGVLGGIVGVNYGTVENCVSYGMTLTAPAGRVGGIVGDYNGGTVTNCYTTYASLGSTASGYVGTATNCEAGISDERMASGEITHKMNSNLGDNDFWYQTVGTGGPLVNSETDHIGKIVYYFDFGDFEFYSNNEAKVVLKSDFTIPAGKTLLIPSGITLEIAQGFTLTNEGTLIANGTLSGKGSLAGNGAFQITDLDEGDITVPTDFVFDGADHYNAVVDGLESGLVMMGKTFSVTGYTRTLSFTSVKDAGEYTVTYTADHETLTYSFNVTVLEVADSDVSLLQSTFDYNGQEREPLVSLTGIAIELGKDYYVTYQNNIAAGEATATITFRGNISGEFTRTFTILPVVIGVGATVDCTSSMTFTGLELNPVTVSVGDVQLVRDVDYTITFENNIYPGTATAKVVGIGSVSGTANISFEIIKPVFTVTVLDQVFPYNEDINVKPFDQTMYEGEGLIEGHTVVLGESTEDPGEVITVLQILDANGNDVLEHYDLIITKGQYHMFYDKYTWDNDGYHWRNCAYNCDEKADYEKHYGGVVSCSQNSACVECGTVYLYATGEHYYTNGVCDCGLESGYVLVVDTDGNGQHSGTEEGLQADGIHNIFDLTDYQFVVVKDFEGGFAGINKANATVTLDLLGHTIDMTNALYAFSMQAENLTVTFKSTAEEMGVLIGATQLAVESVTFTLDNVRHEGTLYNMGTIRVINGSLLYSAITNRGTIYLPEGYDLSTIVSYTGNGALYVGEKAFVYNAESGKFECAADHTWVDADCTNAKTCSVCGATDGEALGHDTNGPATCEEDEYCSRCDSVINEKLGHSEKTVSAVAPTCEDVGYTESVVCANCDHVFVAPTEVPALGHTEADPVNENVVEATCGVAGSYDAVVYCSVCNKELSRVGKTTPALEHDEVESVYIEEEPTCTADGYVIYKYTCNNCGTSRYSEQIPVLAQGHTPGDPEVISQSQPGCEDAGFVVSVINCTVCNETVETIEETLPATGHTPDIEAPTCTQAQYCEVCSTLLQGIASHDYEETVVEADCYISGGINYVCKDCNTGYFDETQAALGHSYNLESSTCTEDKYCTRCKVVFEFAKGHTDVWATCTTPHYCSTCEEVLSAASGHTFNAEEADCVQSKYCVVCNYVEAEKLGHDPDREAPTCTEPVRCTRCPAVLEYETGHTYNNEGGVTCTEDYYCTTCNKVFGYASGHLPMFADVQCEVDNTCIRCEVLLEAAAGHDYKAETLREASCQSEGVISHTCQRCYNSYEEYPPKLEHNPVKEDDVPSTCTQQGHTGATVCSLCGKVFTAQSPLPLLDHNDENGDGKCDACGYNTECEHSWNEGAINSAPTCTQQGVKTLTCLVCGDVKTETIEALGHTEEAVVGKAATCTESGLTDGKKCSVCAEVLVAQETIEALGHSYSEATCIKKATCSVCNAETGELADHVDASEDDKCDVCQYQMSTPEESTPAESTPEESTPVESTPEESTPIESTPEESTPIESTPEESTPVESTPEESTPAESTPEESTPAESTPEESTPDEGNSEEEPKEGLSGGVVAGVVAGSTAVVGGGGFAIWWFAIRNRAATDIGVGVNRTIRRFRRK